jgi:hypothetical protein
MSDSLAGLTDVTTVDELCVDLVLQVVADCGQDDDDQHESLQYGVDFGLFMLHERLNLADCRLRPFLAAQNRTNLGSG